MTASPSVSSSISPISLILSPCMSSNIVPSFSTASPSLTSSRDFGNDGRNYTVKSRFPCFYTQGSNDFVAAYFDLEKSHKIYLMMLWIPMIIFVTSCFFCFFCSYLVIVDKQGKSLS